MKRLFDDPSLPPELRADLQRSRRAGEDYDALAKLPQLRAAWSDPSGRVDDGPAQLRRKPIRRPEYTPAL